MALSTMQVQGSDGTREEVLLDTITGQTYAIPIYKVSYGVAGSNDALVSATTPLPVGSVGDGELGGIFNNHTVGTTKGVPMFGMDKTHCAADVGRLNIVEVHKQGMRVNNGDIVEALTALVEQQKVTNAYLAEMLGESLE